MTTKTMNGNIIVLITTVAVTGGTTAVTTTSTANMEATETAVGSSCGGMDSGIMMLIK